jgi:hypothetical protein
VERSSFLKRKEKVPRIHWMHCISVRRSALPGPKSAPACDIESTPELRKVDETILATAAIPIHRRVRFHDDSTTNDFVSDGPVHGSGAVPRVPTPSTP